MQVHVLHTETDYQAALETYEAYFDDAPEPGSEAGDHFELLGLLIAKYEDDTFPMPKASPVEAIRFAMDRLGLTQSDLAILLGARSRASELLNGIREPSLPQIRKLSSAWKIPVAALVGPYEHA